MSEPGRSWPRRLPSRRSKPTRAERWEELRQQSTQPRAPLPPLTTSAPHAGGPAAAGGNKPAWSTSSAFALVAPPAVALLLAMGALLSLPLWGLAWRPFGALPLGLAFWLGLILVRGRGRSRASVRQRTVGVGVACALLAFFCIGLFTQAAPGGQPQLVGSVGAQTDRQLQDARGAERILRENLGFLGLTPEQAAPVLPQFAQAAGQAREIAARWNPATAGELPVPSLYEVYARLNAAAAKETQALELAAQVTQNPEPSVAAQVAQLNQEVLSLLGQGPGSVGEAMRQAEIEAGIGARP